MLTHVNQRGHSGSNSYLLRFIFYNLILLFEQNSELLFDARLQQNFLLQKMNLKFERRNKLMHNEWTARSDGRVFAYQSGNPGWNPIEVGIFHVW